MADEVPIQQLGRTIRSAREHAGLSIRRCAAAASVDATWLSRVERGRYSAPDLRKLGQVARVLEIDVADLYVAGGFQPARSLPSLAPYLRAKYDLPADAVQDLERHFALLRKVYGDDAHDASPKDDSRSGDAA